MKANALLDEVEFASWRRIAKIRIIHAAAVGVALSENPSAFQGLYRQKEGPEGVRIAKNLTSELLTQFTPFGEAHTGIQSQNLGESKLPYQFDSEKLFLYVVEIKGSAGWIYHEPRIDLDEVGWRVLGLKRPLLLWESLEHVKKLSFYKVGITRHKDIATRFSLQRDWIVRIVFQMELARDIAYNAESLFRSKLFVRFPKSAGPTYYTAGHCDDRQKLRCDGSSESFVFWGNEADLIKVAGDTIMRIEHAYSEGGIDCLNRQRVMLELLLKSIITCSWLAARQDPNLAALYPWSMNEAENTILDALNKAPSGSNPEDLLRWTVTMVRSPSENTVMDDIDSVVQLANRHSLLSLAQDPFLTKVREIGKGHVRLEEFGFSIGNANKISRYKEWCNTAIQLPRLPLNRQEHNQEQEPDLLKKVCALNSYLGQDSGWLRRYAELRFSCIGKRGKTRKQLLAELEAEVNAELELLRQT